MLHFMTDAQKQFTDAAVHPAQAPLVLKVDIINLASLGPQWGRGNILQALITSVTLQTSIFPDRYLAMFILASSPPHGRGRQHKRGKHVNDMADVINEAQDHVRQSLQRTGLQLREVACEFKESESRCAERPTYFNMILCTSPTRDCESKVINKFAQTSSLWQTRAAGGLFEYPVQRDACQDWTRPLGVRFDHCKTSRITLQRNVLSGEASTIGFSNVCSVGCH